MENYRRYVSNYVDESRPENRVVFEALDFAAKLHEGQRRKSNEPYIIHPLAVAQILVQDLNVKDPHMIAAALLHDVVEDVAHVTLQDIKERFGDLVAELVDGCTKMKHQRLARNTLSDLTHSKIFLSSSRQVGVLVIKLADRLHNIKTLKFLPKAKRRRIARETIEVYAPLANKLNLFHLKRELFGLALPYLYPKKSKKITNATQRLLNSPEVFEAQQKFRAVFTDYPFPILVRPRAKSLGAYYSPLKKNLDFQNAENRVDFTLVLQTDDVFECYYAFGVANNLFAPVPRSIRDFIANPKSNGYQSIHFRTRVNDKEFLVKVRTEGMEAAAQHGLLSKWDFSRPRSDRYWKEVSDLFQSLGEYEGTAPQRRDLIRISGTDEIFVYTPRGDIHYLPQDSIVLDFAYKIHSNLGERCSGAHINGQYVPITETLRDGDTVKVLSDARSHGANTHLETLCKTPKARSAVNKQLYRLRSEYAAGVGREILIQELHRVGLNESCLDSDMVDLFLEFKAIPDLNSFYSRIGQDLLSARELIYYFESSDPGADMSCQFSSDTPKADAKAPHRNIFVVKDIFNTVHKFSNCCHPYPGQADVVGALSERGVAFHRRECRELATRHQLDLAGLLDVRWEKDFQWETPLVFDTRVTDKSLSQTLTRLKLLPTSIRIHQIKEQNGKKPRTSVNISLNSFKESESFFACFEPGTVAIEQFSRDTDPKGVQRG
jgi:GTP diphosphokinase / guanosine-3',5'-bis(diphosphate) 3'-diphosphatase